MAFPTGFIATSIGGGTSWLAWSVDGSTWTVPSGLSSRGCYCVCWSADLGIIVALCDNGRIVTSTDGVTWTEHGTINSGWHDCAWSPSLGLFAAVSYNGYIATSSDGVNWTTRATGKGALHGIAWSPELGKFVTCTNAAPDVYSSSNGTTWTLTSGLTTDLWRSVAWSPTRGKFCAVAPGNVIGTQIAMCATSTDGTSWTTHTPPTTGLIDVRWAPQLGKFLACTTAGYVLASSDGATWTTSSTTRSRLVSLDFDVASARIASGGSGLTWSSNGSSWTSAPGGPIGDVRRVRSAIVVPPTRRPRVSVGILTVG